MTDQKYPYSLSVVMPVYNEDEVIEKVVQGFAGILEGFDKPEFVIVNDCSTDSTLSILESLQKTYPFLRVITPPENRGHGPSLAMAYRESKGEYIFHCDSDHQFLPDDFWLLWERMATEQFDVVIGNRASRNDPLSRLLLTRLVRLFLWLFLGVSARDSNVPFRLHTRAALDQILPLIPERPLVPSILMVVAACKLKLRICWVDVRHLPRLTGKSFIRSWKIFKVSYAAVQEVLSFKRHITSYLRAIPAGESEQHVRA